jgi:hypothetical protein
MASLPQLAAQGCAEPSNLVYSALAALQLLYAACTLLLLQYLRPTPASAGAAHRTQQQQAAASKPPEQLQQAEQSDAACRAAAVAGWLLPARPWVAATVMLAPWVALLAGLLRTPPPAHLLHVSPGFIFSAASGLQFWWMHMALAMLVPVGACLTYALPVV